MCRRGGAEGKKLAVSERERGKKWGGRKKNRSHRATVQAPVKTAREGMERSEGKGTEGGREESCRNFQQMREALVSIPGR